MHKNIPASVIAENKWIVEQFVVRARKIETTKLGSSLTELEKLTSIQRILTPTSDGSITFSIPNVPNEDEVESLALYARTMVLSDDPVHFTKSANAVKILLKQNGFSDELLLVEALKKSWINHIEKPKQTWSGKEKLSIESGQPMSEATNVDLAWGWIYGETFHHGEKSVKSLSNFDVNAMFESAYPLIAEISIHAIKLLELVRTFQKSEKISVDNRSFEKDVRYNPDYMKAFIKQVAYIGPDGAEIPPIGATEVEMVARGFEKLNIFTNMTDEQINEYLQKRSEEFTLVKVVSDLRAVVSGKDFSDCFTAAINKIVVEDVADFNIAAQLFRAFGLGIEVDTSGREFRIKGSTEADIPFNQFSALIEPLAIFFDGEVTVSLKHNATGASISKTFNSESGKRVRNYHGLNSEESLGSQFREFYGVS